MGARTSTIGARDDPPVLAARPGGVAERFAGAIGYPHPALAFVAALLAGLVLLAAASLGLALFVVHVVVSGSGLGLGGADEALPEALAHHRDGTLTTLSQIGTDAGGPALPILVGLIALACAFRRRWRIAAFVVFALATESAVYRLTSVLVPRDRPAVPRLEDLTVDASYPSGHTAASTAVYAGLALLIATSITNSLRRAAIWTAAILLITFIAFSRMYRGMHHPLDVIGGALVGTGTIVLVVFACRVADAAARA